MLLVSKVGLESTLWVGGGGAPDIAAAETWATWSILGGAKLPLALELCELRLLREDLVPTLLHCGCGVLPFNSPFPGFLGSSTGRGVLQEALWDCDRCRICWAFDMKVIDRLVSRVLCSSCVQCSLGFECQQRVRDRGAYAPVAPNRSRLLGFAAGLLSRPVGRVVVAARPGRPPATGNVRARPLSVCQPASPFIHSVVSHPHPGKPALALEALPGENSRQTNFATPSS